MGTTMKRDCRKTSLTLAAMLLVGLMSSPPAYAVEHPGAAMKGGNPDYAKGREVKGASCSQAVQRCKKASRLRPPPARVRDKAVSRQASLPIHKGKASQD